MEMTTSYSSQVNDPAQAGMPLILEIVRTNRKAKPMDARGGCERRMYITYIIHLLCTIGIYHKLSVLGSPKNVLGFGQRWRPRSA